MMMIDDASLSSLLVLCFLTVTFFLRQTSNFTKEEFVHILQQSTGFARGSSKYRGVTLHKCGRWEPRMGGCFVGKGKKPFALWFTVLTVET